ERFLLFGCRLFVNDQNSFRGVRVRVRVAKRRACLYDANDAEAIERNAVPIAFLDSPRKYRLIAREVDFPVGDAWASPNVCAARFNIIARNMLRLNACRQSKDDCKERR